jgi:hypothetical protein
LSLNTLAYHPGASKAKKKMSKMTTWQDLPYGA